MSFRTIADHHQRRRGRGDRSGSSRYRVVSLRREPGARTSPRTSRRSSTTTTSRAPHLERVLGVALLFALVIVGGRAARATSSGEPFREADATDGFEERSVERGAVLFANDQTRRPTTRTKSLLLRATATASTAAAASRPVHGEERPTRAATRSRRSTSKLAEDAPECLPQQVAWAAPNLQLAPLRYDARAAHRDHHLRPAGHADARVGRREREGPAQRAEHRRPRELPREHPDHARQGAGGLGGRREERSRETARRPRGAGGGRQVGRRHAGRRSTAAEAAPRRDHAGYQRANDRRGASSTQASRATRQVARPIGGDATQSATDGEILFMNNCARCHTRGWSYFDPTDPESTPAPGPMGGGAYGPNLRDGAVDRQFPSPAVRRRATSAGSRPACRSGPGLRHPRHLVGPHAALRRRPHQGTDRSDHGVRADALVTGCDACTRPRRRARSTRACGTRRSSACSSSSPAIALFCGSIYLLLGTNLGARLGFLVAFTGAHRASW